MKDIVNRKGRIKITSEFIKNPDQEYFALLFGSFFPYAIKMDDVWILGYSEYFGYSQHFKLLEPGEIIPFYNVVFDRDNMNNLILTFEQKNDED